MSLVNYGSSDDDESSDSNIADGRPPAKSSNENESIKNQIQNDDPIATNKTSSLLSSIKTLKPKNGTKPDQNRIKIEAFDRELIANQQLSDSDSDDEESRRKRFKKSEKGSSLISMLPKPKNQPSKKSSTLLVPNSVSSRSKTRSPTITTGDTSGKNFFFTADSGDEDDDDDGQYLAGNDHIHPPKDDGLIYGPTRPPEPLPQASSSKEDPNDDYTLKKYIASKFDDQADNIKIIDVDLSKHLSENKEWLKNISLEKDIKDEDIKTKAPNSLAKRKNQITFLAFQAQKRELELKNQWAQNKQAKNQSKAKYGF